MRVTVRPSTLFSRSASLFAIKSIRCWFSASSAVYECDDFSASCAASALRPRLVTYDRMKASASFSTSASLRASGLPPLEDHVRRARFGARRHRRHIGRFKNEEPRRARARSRGRHIDNHRHPRAQNRRPPWRASNPAARPACPSRSSSALRAVGVGAPTPASLRPRSPAEWCRPEPACRQPAAAQSRMEIASDEPQQGNPQTCRNRPDASPTLPHRLSHGSPLSSRNQNSGRFRLAAVILPPAGS